MAASPPWNGGKFPWKEVKEVEKLTTIVEKKLREQLESADSIKEMKDAVVLLRELRSMDGPAGEKPPEPPPPEGGVVELG